MLRHYVELKLAHPERVLLYRLGDFYECFFEDAIRVSRLLELTPQLEGVKIRPPAYFMMGSRDIVKGFIPPDGMEDHFEDLRGNVRVEGVGHWLPLEATEMVNEHVIAFLANVK